MKLPTLLVVGKPDRCGPVGGPIHRWKRAQ
jgi:hypothetical protein